MKTAAVRHVIAALLAIAGMSAASAQYVWLDAKGVRQYSDQAPPASVPASRILKQPGGTKAATGSVDSAPSAATPNTADTQPPMTTTERNTDFQRRRAAQAEKDKKAAEEASRAEAKAKACERARDYQRVLDSGERITRMGATGEREFLNDSQRQQEAKENSKTLQDCK